MPDTKAIIDDEGHVSGWLAPCGGPFNGKDLDGEFFTKDTDFGLDYYPTIPILWGHGRDGEIGAAKVGEVTVKEIRDQGVWVEGQLNRQSSYYAAIHDLVTGSQKDSRPAADLYWSSGAISHLVAKDGRTGEIKHWPIAEATLTVTPANPAAKATVKSDDEPPTVTAVSPAGFTVTITYPTKEGRRHNAVDRAKLQQIHQLLSELGADPEPESPVVPEPEAGKEAPPANVLTIVGNAAATPPSEFDTVKESLVEFARTEARRLVG